MNPSEEERQAEELFSCPRRPSDKEGIFRPLLGLPGADRWCQDRWTEEPIPAETVYEPGKEPVVKRWQVGWSWPWLPRSCSFCGSIHPEDALRLLEEGWEHEGAKRYKFYLQPPGYRAHMEQVIKALREHREIPAGPKSPVPCVKAYTFHFSKEQLERLNNFVFGKE